MTRLSLLADAPETTAKPATLTDAEFIQQARERFDFGMKADADDRKRAKDANSFANATDKGKEQWLPEMAAMRVEAKRPVLQWNRLPTSIQQVVNEGRRNQPAIKISQGVGGQQETAEFFQNRIRQIAYECNGEAQHDRGRGQQVESGRAFFRVGTRWKQGTFEQEAYFQVIENQFSVVLDPDRTEEDDSDMDYAFVISYISKEKHKRLFGDKSPELHEDFAKAAEVAPAWIGVGTGAEEIQIADYYYRTYRKRTLLDFGNGVTGWADEFRPEDEKLAKSRREEDFPTVHIDVIDGMHVLKSAEWFDTTIPIIPQWGRQALVNGERRTFSLTENAKEPQRVLNLEVSNLVEQIAMMPKTPTWVPLGAIPAGSEADYENLSNTAKAYILYCQYDEQGKPLNQPHREVNEPPIQAILEAISSSIEAIKASMGIYDAALGAQSNETSAKAIRARQAQAGIANFHFPDNEARARKRIGEILVKLIPLIDKPGSQQPVRFEDGRTEIVPIDTAYTDKKTGKQITHTLTAGDYGVFVSTGLSYANARAEANERLNMIAQANPEVWNILGDQILATDEFPGNQQMAERMKRFIGLKNPGLIQEDDEIPSRPQDAAQIAQLTQELQQAHAFGEENFKKAEDKQADRDKDIELKRMQIEFDREKLSVDTAYKDLVLKLDAAIAGQQADTALLQAQLDAIKQAQQHSHEAEMAAAANQQAQEMQASQQAAETAQAGAAQ